MEERKTTGEREKEKREEEQRQREMERQNRWEGELKKLHDLSANLSGHLVQRIHQHNHHR